MKVWKYIFSTMLVGSVLTPSIFAAEGNFSDVDANFWAEAEIEYLAEEGIISGYDDGTFKPNEPVKRSQAASMIVEAFDLQTEDRPAADFTDIDQNYFAYDVAATVQDENIIGGNDGRFMPNDALTRGQMAAVLNRASSDVTSEGDQVSFEDMSQGDAFYNDVQAIAAHDITTGYSDGTFGPNDETTRAQFSVFLARTLDESFISDESDAPAQEPSSGKLEAHFIDVGQGDSIFVEYPNDQTMLVDGGTKSDGEKVVSYLLDEGVSSIDYLVSTHPDADHIGGLTTVLEELEVNNALGSGKTHTTETYDEYVSLVEQEGLSLSTPTEGATLGIDSAVTTKVLNVEPSSSDNNEASVVLKLSYGESDVLLTGDAGVEQEQDMVNEYNVEADILKAGHHGSNTSSSAPFIEEVDPEATILSYGEDNQHGHPVESVVDRLRNAGSDIYSTAEEGDIVFSITEGDYTVTASPWEGDGTPTDAQPEPEPTPQPDPEPEEPQGQINVNTAGYEELQEITGVGPTIAENIMNYREANGPFESIEELDNVSYIGPATIDEMRPDVTLD
ncbi:S-layer homology domain-containing protein [Salibacterium halotolerans]|uniref:Competence protein ComEA helix-hairpin-helix repeat region n=1 Tax=Salibacterium halotolerans TaxID=1884432 RepID=A0A1I5NCV6_9BACI|nr:S-layer homology domain-containing protein [Salibacterium halotolerans]SFP19517.1 competence protein ComEA helix-hairpin-helix repeat region [Salibacterium halotolerans]